jgi:hypothetical protein
VRPARIQPSERIRRNNDTKSACADWFVAGGVPRLGAMIRSSPALSILSGGDDLTSPVLSWSRA